MSEWIRRFHRWIAMAFMAGVAVNTIVILGQGGKPPAGAWIYLLALVPLFALMATGFWMLVRPYFGEGRRRQLAQQS